VSKLSQRRLIPISDQPRAPSTSKTIGADIMKLDLNSPESASPLLECARLHGENSEPDHEVGDLAAFFVACWTVMTPEQRALALSDPQMQDVIDGPDYESLL
jgi:hypothetical protein